MYVLGCDQDSDADGLTDAFEDLVSKTIPTNPQTHGGVPDKDAYLLATTRAGAANLSASIGLD